MAAQQRYEFGKKKKRNGVYVVQSLELFTNISKANDKIVVKISISVCAV